MSDIAVSVRGLGKRYRLVHDGSFRVVAVRRTFDAQGNLVRLTRPDGSMTEWTYDHANADPRARTTTRRSRGSSCS